MDIGLNLSLLQWNIQGYINNKYALELLVSKHKPDIIILQETHIVQKNLHLLHLPNYKVFHHNKDFQYCKSGIGFLIKSTLNVSNHVVSSNNLLHQTITVHGLTELHITNIYKEIDVYLTTQLLDNIPAYNTGHHLLLGDLNSHNILWGSQTTNRNGKIWEEFANNRNLAFLNDGSPTLLNTKNTLTAVDVTMASVELAGILSWNCFPQGSDHFPILIFNNITPGFKKFKPGFVDAKANWELFSKKTEQIGEEFVVTKNVNQEAANIKKIIRKSANESMPTKKNTILRKNPVWFNTEIAKLIDLKNTAWKAYKSKRNLANVIKYKKQCAQVRRACIQAKRDTWKNFVNSLNPTMDTKTIWYKIKKIKSPQYVSFPTIFSENQCLTHPQTIADKLADTWSSIGSDKSFDTLIIRAKQNYEIDSLPGEVHNPHYKFNKITIEDLNIALKNSKGTTPGIDKITYPMIQHAHISLKIRICQLYTRIVETGTYPHYWKVAILAPISKPNKSANLVEGYRPISLISVLAKVFDKILARKIRENCKSHFLPEQHAFLPHHGVHTLCHTLEEKIKANIKAQKHNVILSEDIEKAFDRVISFVVLKELARWGVPAQVLKTVHSFMSHRRITVQVDGFLSKIRTLDNGLPQGSPLSVILFAVYCNTLIKKIRNINGVDFIGVYADNIFVASSGTTEQINSSLNEVNTKVQQWAKATGAVVPMNKADAMHICKKQKCNMTLLKLSNHEIRLKPKISILGLTFSRNALWNEHVNTICEKLGKVNNLLKIFCTRKKGPHIDVAVSICRTISEGIIQHGLTIYGWTSEKNKNKINTAMNRCFRTAAGLLKATPVDALRLEARYYEINWLLHRRSANLAAKAMTLLDHPLHRYMWEQQSGNKRMVTGRKASALENITRYINNIKTPIPAQPPKNWVLSNVKFHTDMTLCQFKKQNTNVEIFKTAYASIKSEFNPELVLFTDGSNQDDTSTYALIEQTSRDSFKTLKQALLPPHAGIFNAELAAVEQAIIYAAESKVKTLICCDSQSVIKYIGSTDYNGPNIPTADEDQIIKIIWIPGHVGIKGNEQADLKAKEAFQLPLTVEAPCYSSIITNYCYKSQEEEVLEKWRTSNSFLYSHNPQIKRPNYNINFTRDDCIKIARMRVGTTLFTISHYYNGNSPLECSICSTPLTTEHMLQVCPLTKVSTTMASALDCSKIDTINIVNNTLKSHNVYYTT